MNKIPKYMIATVLIFCALVSIFFVTDKMASPASHEHTIESIDQKVGTVLELTAATTATSALVSALPGDTATPIADKMADFSSYFLLVVSILYLEKYLVTVTGYAAFMILVPLALVFLAIGLYRRPAAMKRLAKKLGIFAAALYLAVPMSIGVSDIIYDRYEASIQETIADATNASNDDALLEESDEGESILSYITSGARGAMDWATTKLNMFIKALAVMVVTSCLIPVLVFLFLVWLTKVLLEGDASRQIVKLMERANESK